MSRAWLTIAFAVSFSLLACPAQTSAQLIRTAAGNGGFGYAGDGGPAGSSVVNSAYGVAVDSHRNLYIADTGNQRIRVVNTQTTAITVANVTIQPGNIATVAGDGTSGYSGDGGQATVAELYNPVGLAVDGNGNIYIADWGNGRIRKVDTGGTITTITGNGTGSDSGDNGPASQATLSPYAVAVDSKGNLYIADTAYVRIRAVNMGANTLTVGSVSIPAGYIATVAGNGTLGSSGDNGPATAAEFNYPYSVAVDAAANIYICDTYNREMRMVNAGATPLTVAGVTIQPGNIATIAGNSSYGFRGDGYVATSAEFADPDGITLDSNGNIYVSDLENARIRVINKTTGIIGTVAGTGIWSYNSDGLPAITSDLNEPRTIAVDGVGNVYIADQANSRIREVSVSPGVPVFTNRASTAFIMGTKGTFLVTTADLPVPQLGESGALPAGVTFTDNGNGTATLTGIPVSTANSPFILNFTAANGVLPSAQQTFSLTIYPPGGAPAASFVGTDAGTGGNWQGVYGADGYALANITPQNIPSYAAFAMQNQVNYTWDANAVDPRALNVPGSSSRVAATWYTGSIFNLDVNVGAGSHQVALYAVDWDSLGRSETIQIQDANTGVVLDTEVVSNFSGGVYLIWNISGHVQILVSPNGAPNGVISAIFFGGASTLPSPILNIAKKHTGNFTQSQQNVNYTVTVSNLLHAAATSGAVTVTETPPAGMQLVSMQGMSWACTPPTCTRGDALGGGTSYQPITVTMNVAANAASPQVNQVNVSWSGGTGTASASDSATIAPSATVAQASFVRSDTATQGNWTGVYGTDGYFIANVATSITPTYGSFTVENQTNYTWIVGVSDPRALIGDAQGHRIASAWYSPSNFSLDISTDGNLHQIALYALDWDSGGRAETIKVVDANSGVTLDTRSIPDSTTGTSSGNFVGGTYLIWNISGHVIITVTANAGPNAVISGIFFGSAMPAAPQITNAANAVFTVGTAGSFTVTTTGTPTAAITESGALPAWLTFTDNGNGTATLQGTPAADANLSYTYTFMASNGVSPNATQGFTLAVNPKAVVSGPAASFATADTSTQGSWMGVYGADGYAIANGPQSPAGGTLSYGTYSVQSESEWTWAQTTSDKRGLETDSQGERTAATWYSGGSFSFDVNFTDKNSHQVALYVLDWDSKGRGETVSIVDAGNPGNVLSTRAVPDTNTGTTNTNFANGTYLVWNISGHVTITVKTTAGPNGVVAGIFFGAAGVVTPPPVATAAWVGSDAATQGAWIGKYGTAGYSLANAGQNFLIPASLNVENSLTPYTWAQNPNPADPRDLQTDTLGHQIAATWYNNSSFSLDLNLTDGAVHQVALYVLDWDSKGRAETISITDANSETSLDTRAIPNANSSTTAANFPGGTYLIWNISGHVTIKVTANSGPNAVVSGVFLQ